MIDTNKFKQSIKHWVQSHPDSNEQSFRDFCEELIPPQHYATYEWLVDQSVSWYNHMMTQKESAKLAYEDLSDVA
jgi:hypothetical protein